MGDISTSSLLKGALTFTAALAWNEAAKNTINIIYPNKDKDTIMAQLSYAIIITVLVILIVTIFNYINGKLTFVRNKMYRNTNSVDIGPYMLNSVYQ